MKEKRKNKKGGKNDRNFHRDFHFFTVDSDNGAGVGRTPTQKRKSARSRQSSVIHVEEANDQERVRGNLLAIAEEEFRLIDSLSEPSSQCRKKAGQKMVWGLKQEGNFNNKYLQGAFTSWLETIDDYAKDWQERQGRDGQRKRLSGNISMEGQPYQKTPFQSDGAPRQISKSSHSSQREGKSHRIGKRDKPPISPLTTKNLERHEETIQIQESGYMLQQTISWLHFLIDGEGME